MARSSSDAGVQDAFAAAGLTRGQRALLHTVLRALDDGSGPGVHAATSDSALVALIRAHDAVRNHDEYGQPQGRTLVRVLRTSAACVRNALPVFPEGVLRPVLQELEAQRVRASALGSMITSVADAITAQMRALWDASAGNPGRDAKAAGEIAVSVYLGGRDHQALKRDMTTLLSRGRPTADDIVALLWPPPRRHHVTVMVSGARSLDHLDVLLPGARQLSVTVRQNPPKAAELAALVAKVGPIRARGRRVVSEALDQYVAGNRIADLTLADAWVVAGPDGRWVLGELARAGVRRAAPLSSWWSDGLRPALRVAHIARRVEAPMTSAALCWSALESIGVDEKPARLARAFALQTLRQHIVDAHAQLRLMVTDRLRRLGLRARKSQDTLRRADAVTQARQSWLDHDAAHQSALGDTTALMALVDAHVPRTTDKPLLTEPDRWLDLLLPARDTDSPALTAAHDAVTALSAFAGGLTEDTITLWRARLARPSQLAKWLQDKQDTCHALLDWLYTTRNTAFHHGRFAGPLDLATTHAAQAVVDLLLEVLGRWHTTQHTRG